MQNRLLFVALVAIGVSSSAGAASAQVAGSTVLGVGQRSRGNPPYTWPERQEEHSGIDRHDVAVPVTALEDKGGKLILPGATKDTIKSLPRFDYASDTTQRDQFVANAREDMGRSPDRC